MENQVASERRQMVFDIYDAIDSKDVDRLLGFMAPAATQRLGNREPLRGHDEIRAANTAFFARTRATRHEITGLWETDDTVIVRLSATYKYENGQIVTIPAATIMRLSDGLIVEYQVFVDMAPVLAAAGA